MKIRNERKLDYVAMASKKKDNKEYLLLVQFANDIFISYAIDTAANIKKSHLYTREIKREVNGLDKAIKSYSKWFNNGLVNQEAFATCVDYIQDMIKNDIMLLKIAIKQALSDRNTREYEIYADMELSLCMGCMAIAMTDNISANYCSSVTKIRVDNIIYAYKRLADIFISRFGKGVDLRIDHNITAFISTLAVKLCDYDIIDTAMELTERDLAAS